MVKSFVSEHYCTSTTYKTSDPVTLSWHSCWNRQSECRGPTFFESRKKNCTTFVVLWDLSLVTRIFKKVLKKWGRFTSTLSRRITSVRTFQTDTQIVGSPPNIEFFLVRVSSPFFFSRERQFFLLATNCPPFVIMWVENVLSGTQLSNLLQLEANLKLSQLSVASDKKPVPFHIILLPTYKRYSPAINHPKLTQTMVKNGFLRPSITQ